MSKFVRDKFDFIYKTVKLVDAVSRGKCPESVSEIFNGDTYSCHFSVGVFRSRVRSVLFHHFRPFSRGVCRVLILGICRHHF